MIVRYKFHHLFHRPSQMRCGQRWIHKSGAAELQVGSDSTVPVNHHLFHGKTNLPRTQIDLLETSIAIRHIIQQTNHIPHLFS